MSGDALSGDALSGTGCTGYTSLSGTLGPSLYLAVSVPTRFKDAEQACEAAKGHLVILGSDEERIAVGVVGANGWVGFSDLKNEGTWIDIAGRASTYMDAHWAPTEPSMGGNDNCAFINAADDLDATNCGSSDGSSGDMRGYLCECGDGVQGKTSSFNRD